MKMKMAMKGKMMKSMMMKKMGMKKKAMKKTAKSYKLSANAKRAVFNGIIAKSKGGLTKAALMKSKSGKIVSAKKSALGKKSKWMAAVAKARKELKIKGFQIIGGKSAKGQAFLKKAKSFYKK